MTVETLDEEIVAAAAAVAHERATAERAERDAATQSLLAAVAAGEVPGAEVEDNGTGLLTISCAVEPAVPEVAEMASLGAVLGTNYRLRVEAYKRECALKDYYSAAERVEDFNAWQARQPQTMDPREVSWTELEALTGDDPVASLKRWQEIREAARDWVAGGMCAADAVAGNSETPFRRAVFYAFRDQLILGWQPQNGVECALIDQAAQAMMERYRWLELAARRRDGENLVFHGVRSTYNDMPSLTDVEATDRALVMAERWERALLRTLRHLRDLRRYAGSVTIQNHGGQVNMAAGPQQVNCSAT